MVEDTHSSQDTLGTGVLRDVNNFDRTEGRLGSSMASMVDYPQGGTRIAYSQTCAAAGVSEDFLRAIGVCMEAVRTSEHDCRVRQTIIADVAVWHRHTTAALLVIFLYCNKI